MTFSHALLPVFTLTLLTSVTSFASRQELEAASLIEHAKQLSDIRAQGMPAFRLKINFKAISGKGRTVEGTYMEVWASRALWRREITIGDFSRKQVAVEQKRWTLDSATVVPEHLDEVLFLYHGGTLQPEFWKPGEIEDRVINGVLARCIERKANAGEGRSALCFDKSTGVLAAEIRPSQRKSTEETQTCLFSDYQAFGGKLVARSYECEEGNQPSLEARLVELAAEPESAPDSFVPPKAAKESVNCLGRVTRPIVVYSPEPTPPRSTHGGNKVTMSVVVGTDGKAYNVTVISAPAADYADSAVEAARQWRFKPATCDGKAMEAELGLEIEFNIF